MTALMGAYELEREQRIASNKRKMEEMGIFKAKQDLEVLVAISQPAPKRQVKKLREPKDAIEPRRSTRERVTVNYCEESTNFSDRLPGAKAERRVQYLNRGDLDPKLFSSPRVRSNFDSGKGVRIQGGRVYDSELGVTCHWCRQKTLESKVSCTDPNCGGGRRLPTSFCRMCLKNRHGEDVDEAEKSGKWVCPGCRVSCGPGCNICCNCGPCRKKAGLAPTRQMIKEARKTGFDNVHDYLVHQATGESADLIALRKLAAAWGTWMVTVPFAEEGLGTKDDELKSSPEKPEDVPVKGNARPKRGAAKPAVDTLFASSKVTKQSVMGSGSKKPSTRSGDRKLRSVRAVGLAVAAVA